MSGSVPWGSETERANWWQAAWVTKDEEVGRLRAENERLIEMHRGQCAYCAHSRPSDIKKYKYLQLRTCDFMQAEGCGARNFEEACKHWTFKAPAKGEIYYPSGVRMTEAEYEKTL